MKLLQGKDSGFRTRRFEWLAVGLGLLLLAGLVACETEEDRIRKANEAAREEQTPVSRDSRAIVDVIELRNGDCFVAPSTVDETGEQVRFTSFEAIPCGEDWMYRVINSFVVQQEGIFPGYDFFTERALRQCPRPTSIYLPPSISTWDQGDRRVLCVEER